MILLDTHTSLWWVSSPDELSAKASRAVETGAETGRLLVSSISAWEVAVLVAKKRLKLDRSVEDWIARVEAIPAVQFLPVDNAIAVRSVGLEGLHDDPADRIIAATAMDLGCALVTKDKRLRGYKPLKTVW